LGDESIVLDVAQKFQAKYLIIEHSDSLGALQDLYDRPQSNSTFTYLGEVAGAHLYRVAP
jgi:hypothetical protein